jgi:hypothetical protein
MIHDVDNSYCGISLLERKNTLRARLNVQYVKHQAMVDRRSNNLIL